MKVEAYFKQGAAGVTESQVLGKLKELCELLGAKNDERLCVGFAGKGFAVRRYHAKQIHTPSTCNPRVNLLGGKWQSVR